MAKTSISLPDPVFTKLAKMAETEVRSISQQIVYLINKEPEPIVLKK